MAKPSTRWMVLLGALAATVVAIFYPTEPDAAAPTTAEQPAPVKQVAMPGAAPTPDEQRARWIAADADPFASKQWQPAPLPEPPKPPPAPLATAEPVAPPPPAPLPFHFVGQMNDGEDRVVYLSYGDQVLLARLGDVLERTYKVVSIDAAHIQFESLPTGLTQTLAIPAKDN